MALTGIYGAVEPDVARTTIHRALDLGVRLFDTAALYADGANEELLGCTLGDRDDAFVVTKFGLVADGGRLLRDSAPSAIRASVDASLRRLRRGRIDLLLQHRPDPAVPDEVVAEVARELIEAGKVAAFGLSGTPVDRIGMFAGTVRVSAVQSELSVMTPGGAANVEAIDVEGAMLMAHSPLGRGLVTGRAGRPPSPDDLRSGMPRFRDVLPPSGAACLQALAEVSASRAVPKAAVALAWALQLGANVVPIPGARSPAQVDEIAGSAALALTREEISRLSARLPPGG